jgi:hypothetical protein
VRGPDHAEGATQDAYDIPTFMRRKAEP